MHSEPGLTDRRVHWVALGGAALVQIAFLALLSVGMDHSPEPNSSVAQRAMILAFIDEPSHSSERSERPTNPGRPHSAVSLLRLLAPRLALPSVLPLLPPNSRESPITVTPATPPIDWTAEAERAARDVLAREDRKALLRAFGSIPKGLDLPRPENRRHRRGESWRFDDGETITWISDRCYYTNRDPAHLPVFITGIPRPLPHPVCKPPPALSPPFTGDDLNADRSDRTPSVP